MSVKAATLVVAMRTRIELTFACFLLIG